MAVSRIKREKVKSIRKRLAEQAPEVIQKRETNFNIQRERRRRTLAANAQAIHDGYLGAIQKNPLMDGLRLVAVTRHKDQLRNLLTEMNSFQDPRVGLPPY